MKVAIPTDKLTASGNHPHIESQKPPNPVADVLSVSPIIKNRV